MPESVFERVTPHVYEFIARLYRSSAMPYAINHSQMEVWIALEGLEHFSHDGWSSWETMGFITRKPVWSKKKRRKKAAEHGIKFPDLVSVRSDLCLWWEFKAIGKRALHPDKSGGTFVRDVHALCELDWAETRSYLEGNDSKGRSRDDTAWIKASKLGKAIVEAKEHVGVALIFAPGDETLSCCNLDPRKQHEQQWSPAKRIGCGSPAAGRSRMIPDGCGAEN